MNSSPTTLPDHREQFVDRAISFLTDVLGFASERVNERVIANVAELLQNRETSPQRRRCAVVASVTIGETYFLRHQSHFSWLVDRWVPSRLDAPNRWRSRPLRVLCAGCSSGEEAYSVAAMLHRKLPRGLDEVHIDAFDVNPRFLDRARRAQYRTWSLRGVQLDEHRDWLRLDGSTVQVCPPVSEAVQFVEHNLLEPLETNPALNRDYDLILCRNVLLYFHHRAVDTAYRHLKAALADSGVLLIGPSDPPPPDSVGFRRQQHGSVRTFRPPHSPAASGDACESSTNRTAAAPDSPQPAVPATDGPPTAPPGENDTTGGDDTPDAPSVDADDVSRVARNLSRIADTRLATKLLEQHLSRHPVDVRAHVLGAQYAAELGDFERAFRWGRRAVYLAPDAPWVTYLMTSICRRSGRDAMIERYLNWTRELLEDSPDTKRLRYSDDCTVRQLKEVLDGIG